MSLESNENVVDTVTVGAMRIADLMNQGLSRDDAELALIRARRGPARSEELRERSAGSRSRASEMMLPEEREQMTKELAAMGIDIDNPNFGEYEGVLNASQLSEYGQDQADMQNATDDDKDFEKRASRRLKQQAADKNDLDIRVGIPNDKGRIEIVDGLVPAGQPVPDDLREAAILQELGLRFPERARPTFPKKKGKDGKERRQFFKQSRSGEKSDLPTPGELVRPQMANAGGLNDAFQRLVAAVERGEVNLGDPVQMGNSSPYPRRNVGDLLESLGLSAVPQQALQADRAQAQRVVDSLESPVNEEVRIRNEKAAQLRAIAEGAKQDMFADERIGRISEISTLGPSKGVDKAGRVQRVTFDNPVVRPDAIEMIGPGRNTVGYVDPETQEFLGEINSGSTSNALNAPKLNGAQQFAIDNIYTQPNAGSPFEVQLKQSFGPADFEIMGPSRAFVERAGGLADLSAFPADIRSSTEVDAIASAIIESELAQGRQFFTKGADGKQVLVENPGLSDVLTKLRYTDKEKSQLARAIFALDELSARGVNADLRQDFEERRRPENQREVMFEATGAQPVIGKVGKNEKVGGKGVGAELRKINKEKIARELDAAGLLYTTGPNGQQVMLPEAREILNDKEALDAAKIANAGVAPGETAERPRFVRGNARNLSTDERVKKFGPKNAEIANEVERRYEEDKDLRAQAAEQKVDPYAVQQRALDSEFAARGRQVEIDREALEIGEIARLQKLGELQLPNEKDFNQDPRFTKERLERVGQGVFKPVTPTQPIQQAAAPQSIAPVPGDVTGSQPAPAVDAGRGGWMGGPGSGRIENPYKQPGGALVRQERGQMVAPSRIEQVSVNVEQPEQRQQPSRSASSKNSFYMDKPEGVDSQFGRRARRINEFMNRADRAVDRRLGRGGRFGAEVAAALGGGVLLGDMITNEREQREEEMV